MFNNNYMEITREYFDNTMGAFSKRLDELVEVNKELVQQNLKLSNKVFEKYVSEDIETGTGDASPVYKNLFYSHGNGCILVTGSGTFDAKSKLKELSCDWVGEIKSWKYTGSLDDLKRAFPEITEKMVAVAVSNVQTASKKCLVRD
jgi:hypothetical protein